MNTPTQAGMIEAARRANEVTVALGRGAAWSDEDFSSGEVFPAFALACDELLAKDAQIAAKDAELGTAKAALGEVYDYTVQSLDSPRLAHINGLAAPYAVAVDPLVEEIEKLLFNGGGKSPRELIDVSIKRGLELAKRGITIPEAGQ